MLTFLKHLIFIALAGLLILGCSKKDEPAVVEEDLLPQDDMQLIEEPAEEISDAEINEAGESAKSDEAEKGDDVKFATIPKKEVPRTPSKKATPSSASSDKAGSPQIYKSGNYVVQVSIYKLQSAANKVKNRLIAKGFPAYVAEIEDPTPDLPGTYYRVRIGYFRGLSKARAFGEKALEPLGYSYWADLASNDNIAKAPDEDSYTASSDASAEVSDDEISSGDEITSEDEVSSSEDAGSADEVSSDDPGPEATGSGPEETAEDDW